MLDTLENVASRFAPLKNPELEYTDPFLLGRLETIDVLAELSESSDIERDGPLHDGSLVDQDEDLWTVGSPLEPLRKEIIHRSWDSFGDNAGREPRSAYISEGVSPVFDAALRLQSRDTLCKDAPSNNVVQYRLLATVCCQLSPWKWPID